MEKTIIPHFRGTTKECLAHYASTLSEESGKRDRKVFRQLAKFTDANVLTVYRWTRGQQGLVGLRLIKARYFLEQLGYVVVELEKLPSIMRDFGRLIAYNLFTVEEAYRDLGFPRSDHFPGLLRGDRNPSPERMAKILELVKAYQPLLDEKGKNFTELYAVNSDKKTTIPSSGGGYPLQAPSNGNPEHKFLLQALAKGLDVITPLAELLLTDVYTPDERRELRKRVDVFRASNALHRLCGEMARTQKAVHWHKTSSHQEQ